jgi:hypothetical protein
MEVRVSWVILDCPTRSHDSLFLAALFGEDRTHLAMCSGEVWLELKGTSIGTLCLVKFSMLLQQTAKVVEECCIVSIAFYRATHCSKCFVLTPLLIKKDA